MRKALLLLTFGFVLQAQEPCIGSAELRQIHDADQKDRESEPIDWKAVESRDEQRRSRVSELVDTAARLCPEDLFHAAMVFQHGREPRDHLLAHVLAVASASDGHEPARWLSAATLDRFLHSVEQPQIFGAQYRKEGSEPWTQEPFDRTIVSDKIRALFRMSALSGQRDRLEEMNRDPDRDRVLP